MKSGPADERSAAMALLRSGLALGCADISHGRAELGAAVAAFESSGDACGRYLAHAAQLVLIGLADDDYTGFETAVQFVITRDPQSFEWADAADALLAEAGSLVAGAFEALDAPALPACAQGIERSLADPTLPAPLRCLAALAALGYHHIRIDLERVLWLELALRPLLADPALGERMADEAVHMMVQSLYQCGEPARAAALREQRFAPARPLLPVIALKRELLDAQMALGSGSAQAGREALARAEPLLDPRAPRSAGWWHLLASRLHLLEGRQRQALTHARLALRLTTESRLPERWMGVTVMQEGQVLMAGGAYLQALPFFERAGRAASGSQARFCRCLAHLARALDHAGTGHAAAARAELVSGVALARELAWLHFFRATPAVAASVCALALEHGVEAAFVREVISARSLHAVRPDLAEWPWPIRVRCLGGLHIEIHGAPLDFKGKVAKKPLELLLFIVASGGADVSASTVAFVLWREQEGDKARAALTAALGRLRRLLGDDEAVLLEHGRLSLNPKRVWVDCLAFEQLTESAGLPPSGVLPAAARAAAERACALYNGDFLQGAEHAGWQMAYHSRLASKFKRMVTLLAAAARARGDSAAARALLERGLEFHPLAEDLASALMRELMDSGEQAAALAVFDRLRRSLQDSLGAKPSPATAELVARLRHAPPD
jgi:DNA-binding SARP family transcriptional activator